MYMGEENAFPPPRRENGEGKGEQQSKPVALTISMKT
jgi:hypothetical protein